MRNLWIVVLVALLLAMAGAAHADAATDALRATVESLQKQLTDALDRLKALEAAKPAAVPAPAPEAKASWTDKLLITAYAHFRYEARDNAVGRFPNGPYAAWPTAVSTPADEFLIRRMYLNFIATPNSKTKIVLALRRLGGSPQTIDLESAFVEYALDDAWSVEFGRVYNKFGWDTWESSSKRLVLDRFAAGEGYGNGGLRGLYSNGPTDMGMYITRKPWADYAPKVHLGLFNGNFIDPENNGNKAYSVDLRWDRNDWHWGLGWIDGDYTESYSAAGQPTVTNTFARTPSRGACRPSGLTGSCSATTSPAGTLRARASWATTARRSCAMRSTSRPTRRPSPAMPSTPGASATRIRWTRTTS
jgi:hypothetical protein